ncbi:MAG: hypothetical protein HGA45_09160 [Chloroflexales bacterium]|nr:hypothetical protein [Chloroflexales bacterium]
MTEQQSDNLVEILRRQLGPRHQSSMHQGRAEITQVLRDELQVGAAEAESLVRQMIDSGQLRYVTGDESPPGAERMIAQPGERPDRPLATPVVPVVTGGTSSPPLVPVSAGDPGAVDAGGQGPGYWDIGGQAAGVVPSTTRKGQVEPRGT